MSIDIGGTVAGAKHTRRNLLRMGGSAGLLILAAPAFAGVAQAQAATNTQQAKEALRDKLQAYYSSPTAQADAQATATTMAGLAATVLAETSALRANGAPFLTGFQKSLLDIMPIVMADPPTLAAALTKKQLTGQQQASAAHMRDALNANPAWQRILSYVEPLRTPGGTAALTADVQQYIANAQASTLSPPIMPSPTGDANLDKINAALFSLNSSQAVRATNSGVIPLLKDPSFIPLLQDIGTPHPEAFVQFVPTSQLLALLLPNDHDPVGLTPAQTYWLNVAAILIFFIAGAIGAVFLPFVLALVTIGLLTVGSLILIVLAADQLAKAQDCDNDGDPGDPDDVPGIECS